MSAYESEQDLRTRVQEAIKYTAECASCSEMLIWFAAKSSRDRYSRSWTEFGLTLNVLAECLFEGLILALYKPLEPESDDAENERVNLWRILNLAGRLGILNGSAHNKLKQKLRAVEPIWSKVKTLRHNLVAHGKVGLSVEEEMRRAGLTSSQWKRLLAAYAEILNAVAEKIGVQRIEVETFRQEYASNVEHFFETLDKVSKNK